MVYLKMMLQNLRDKSKCCKKDDFTGERYTIIHDMSIETLNMICEDGIEQLENAPSVNRWIPFSERKPNEAGEYIVCGRWSGEKPRTWICRFEIFGDIGGFVNHAKNPPISFWMPLPEPPEKE